MKPRPQNDDEDGGLDSLMDTLTNVVGILVLVLVMTQLDVQEAVHRITSTSKVTAEDLEAAKARLKEMESERKKVDERLNSFDISAERERLQRMKETLAAKRKLLEDEKQASNQFAISLNSQKKMAAEKEEEIKASEAERDKLSDEIRKMLEKKAELQAKLEDTPTKPAPPDRLVSIPNPRPAPDGAKQLTIVCKNNKLYPMSIDEIRKDAEEKAKDIITKRKLLLDPAAGVDPKEFEKYWIKLDPPRDEFLDVQYYIQDNRFPRVRLIPKENRGATLEDLEKPRSPIRKLLGSINPQKFFLVFHVLPDSYDIYITARQLMMTQGVEAGWNPEGQTWEYTTSVPGGIELGPPRPKDPNPAPAPAKPAPKPNVID